MTALQGGSIDTAGERGLAITAGVLAHDKATTYATLIASSSAASTGVLVQLQCGDTIRADFLVDVATGAALSEVVRIPDLLFSAATNAERSIQTYFFPGLVLASGSRISVRCQSSTGGATCRVNVALAFDPVQGPTGTSVVAFGVIPGASGALLITPGTNVESAWGELTPSTSSALLGFLVVIGRTADASLTGKPGIALDVGSGGSGSEVAILTDWWFGVDSGEQVSNAVTPFLPIPIDSGVRLAARLMSGSVAYGEDLGIALYGLVA